MVQEAESPRSRCQHGWVLVGAIFWAADCQLVSPCGERAASSLISYKDTNPTYKVPASWPNHPKGPLPNTTTLGVRAQRRNWRGGHKAEFMTISIHLSICQSTCVSIYLPVYLSIYHLSVYLPTYLPIALLAWFLWGILTGILGMWLHVHYLIILGFSFFVGQVAFSRIYLI